MKLSILICSLPERNAHLLNLFSVLDPQRCEDVEILVDLRPRNIPTGIKRNDLIAQCHGDYFCFIDDDDWVDPEYVKRVLEAIDQNPDVITFKGWMTTNGMHSVDWTIKLGEKYEARTDPDGITRYYRFPNHLCPMKKVLVRDIKFAGVWQGEDYGWAKRIHDLELLKSEVHIDRRLYHYKFITAK